MHPPEWNQTVARPSSYWDINSSSIDEHILKYYEIGVPVMLVVCTLTFLVNMLIAVSSLWMRRPLSPTMHFSVSLAGADAAASLIVGLGLVLNSLLPLVYDIPVSEWFPCTILTLEAFRLGAVIVTVVHLLALSINHYIGIIRPLHYAAIMTKRTVTICIAAMWIGPNVAILTSFSIIADQGFQSANCTTDFIQSIRFRGQYSSFFFAPLLAMMFIYTHIFIIIRRHQTARRTLTQQSTLNGVHQGHSNGSRGHDCRFPDGNSQAGSGGPTCRANSNRWSGHQRVHQLSQQWRVGRNASAGSTNPSNADAADQPNSHIKNVKAIITTLLIVGTCILGWMPVVVWFITMCEDCILTPDDTDTAQAVRIGITVNTLIVLKFLLSPIIYTIRMKDFKLACRRMHSQLMEACRCRSRRHSNNRQEDDVTLGHYQRSLVLPSQAPSQLSYQRSLRCMADSPARPLAEIKSIGRLDEATETEQGEALSMAEPNQRATNEEREAMLLKEAPDSRFDSSAPL